MVPVGTNSAASRPKDLGRAPLQQIDSGVLAVDIVAHFGRSHCRAHLQRRPRDSVGTQINDARKFIAPLEGVKE